MGSVNSEYGLITSPALAGAERLWGSKDLLINGVTVAPTFWFDGTGLDDTAKTWTCRQTGTVMTEVGSGDSPDLAALGPHFGDRVAEGQEGKYMEEADLGDVTTEDLVFELTFRHISTTALQRMLGRIWTAIQGYQLRAVSGANLVLELYNAPATVATIVTAGFANGAYYHAMCFCDRNGYAQWYLNAATSGSAIDLTSVQGSLTNVSSLKILSAYTGGNPYGGQIGHAALWARDAWLDTHLQATVAKERAALWMGHTALHNHGSLTPTTL
jgi:hypothetical protein